MKKYIGEQTIPYILIALTFVIYCLNFRPNESYDALPAKYVALSLVRENNFDLDEYSDFLKRQFPSESYTTQNISLPYYMVAGKGVDGVHILNTFGFGVALVIFPLYWIANLIVPIGQSDIYLLVTLGRIMMSLITALTVGVLYVTLRELHTNRFQNILLSIAFGLGTGMWVTASEGTWQHGPAVFCVTLSLYFMIISRRDPRWFKYAAIPASLAVWMRPVIVPFSLTLIVYGFMRLRREIVFFLLLGLPFALIFGWYNYYYFGNPLLTAQTIMQGLIAAGKTGYNKFNQTPFLIGFLGNLFSPSRGLFVYSPFLLFCFANIIYKGNKIDTHMVFFLIISFISLSILPSIHFDWWGGVCYGNRFLIEGLPFLIILLANVFDRIMESRILKVIFIFSLCFSIVVQFVGSAYYEAEWDIQNNISFESHMIWNWKDSQLVYYFQKALNSLLEGR